MKRLMLLPLLLLVSWSCLAAVGWPAPQNGVYRIQGDVDLGGVTVTMVSGSVLDLTQGTLRNGTVVGNESSLSVRGEAEVMAGVILKGSWCGKAEDRWFRLEGNSPYWIVSNVFKFNEVTFFRDAYWLDRWYPITINPDHMAVHGNGVKFYLPSDKGEAVNGTWGYKYRLENLFGNVLRDGRPAGIYQFEDIHIEDNADNIGKPGWGEPMDRFRIYYYFSVIGKKTVYRNVSSDGQGILVKVYNFVQHVDSIEMEGCDVKAGQFAAEIASFPREGYPGGTCDEILIRNCRFYQYSCQPYVGLLSVVGDTLTDQMLIENCVFDATEKDGNLELSSVRHIVFRNNLMINQFVNSYPLPKIERYDILGNRFIFRKHRANCSFNFGGKDIVFKKNELIYEEEDVGFITAAPGVRSLEMVQNTFDFSAIRTLTENRTLLSLSRFSMTGGKLRMTRNKVIQSPAKGSNRIVFNLPNRMESYVGNRLGGVTVR